MKSLLKLLSLVAGVALCWSCERTSSFRVASSAFQSKPIGPLSSAESGFRVITKESELRSLLDSESLSQDARTAIDGVDLRREFIVVTPGSSISSFRPLAGRTVAILLERSSVDGVGIARVVGDSSGFFKFTWVEK